MPPDRLFSPGSKSRSSKQACRVQMNRANVDPPPPCPAPCITPRCRRFRKLRRNEQGSADRGAFTKARTRLRSTSQKRQIANRPDEDPGGCGRQCTGTTGAQQARHALNRWILPGSLQADRRVRENPEAPRCATVMWTIRQQEACNMDYELLARHFSAWLSNARINWLAADKLNVAGGRKGPPTFPAENP